MKSLRYATYLLMLIVAGLGGATWVALEGKEVAVLHTIGIGGTTRRTRVWVADADGFTWVEAATADRPFYRDILVNPAIDLVRQGEHLPFTATPKPGPGGHAKIRRLLQAKYGWADTWVGLLQDTSESIAIRLEATSETTGEASR